MEPSGHGNGTVIFLRRKPREEGDLSHEAVYAQRAYLEAAGIKVGVMGDKIPFLFVHSEEDCERAMILLKYSCIKGWDRYVYDILLPVLALALSA